MNILVVGGAGFLGNAVIDVLIENSNNYVDVLDNLTHEDLYKRMDIGTFLHEDVLNKERIQELICDYDIVIWLAGIVGDKACNNAVSLSNAINVNALKNIKYSGRFIYISSCSVYGMANETDNYIVNEQTEPNPLSSYARQKLLAETIVQNQFKNHAILRLGTLFGFSVNVGRPRFDLVINNFIKQAFMYGQIEYFGGEQIRPFIHVRDIAWGIARLTTGIHEKKVGLYNLATFNMTINQIAEEINAILDNILVIKQLKNLNYPNMRNYALDIEKIKNSGFIDVENHFNIKDAIREFLEIRPRIRNMNAMLFYNV